jgi:hypothetical protein
MPEELPIICRARSVTNRYAEEFESVLRDDFSRQSAVVFRKPVKHPLDKDRPRHIQWLHSQLAREVFHLRLTQENPAQPETSRATGGLNHRATHPAAAFDWILSP